MTRRTGIFAALGAVAFMTPIAIVMGNRHDGEAAAVGPTKQAPTTSTASSQSTAPRLVLSTTRPRPGEVIELRGSRFAPRAPGFVTIAGRRVGTIRTTKSGRFTLDVTVPDTQRGRIAITATVSAPGGRQQQASTALAVESAPTSDALARAPVIMAVGDLTSSARSKGAVAVRNLVATQRPARVLMLGDYQYSYGSLAKIRGGADQLYGPKPNGLWRKLAPTSGPTHDVKGCSPSDYDRYWGRSAVRPYSFNVGAWHLIQLPSPALRYKCDPAAITAWLKRDLAAHRNVCTLAFFHEPYWTRPTKTHPKGDAKAKAWIQVLYAGGVDIVLNGHQHNYQRFAPQDPAGRRNDARGIRAFVVGSGGIGFYPFTGSAPNVAASTDATFGALRLVLMPRGYDWRFLRAGGAKFVDAGRARCH